MRKAYTNASKSIAARLVEPKIAEHHGRIVKTTGDGMLVEFPSVVDAVRCAADLPTQGSPESNTACPSLVFAWIQRRTEQQLLAGKIQGNSPIRGLVVPVRQRKRARNQFLTGQFPTHPNREFFAALQGIESGDQGSFRRD
jgi:hypothetical protein